MIVLSLRRATSPAVFRFLSSGRMDRMGGSFATVRFFINDVRQGIGELHRQGTTTTSYSFKNALTAQTMLAFPPARLFTPEFPHQRHNETRYFSWHKGEEAEGDNPSRGPARRSDRHRRIRVCRRSIQSCYRGGRKRGKC